VFTVNCPPYASLYAGDGQGRLAAFWATAGLDPPAEPDHLAVLLDGYAGLGEAGKDDARRVLFGEFVWPWLPAYLGAVSDLPPAGPDGLVAGVLTPLRSGMILTRRAVAAGAEQVGAGQRIGNRRRALGAMLAAEPERAARWLAGEADRWARRHASGQLGTSQLGTSQGGASQGGASQGGASQGGSAGSDPVQLWWAERAAGTARLLRGIDALRRTDEPRGARESGGAHSARNAQEGVRDGRETEWVSAAD
jgi:hypothetical protein